MRYWLVNSGTSADPHVPPRDDWQARFAEWHAANGEVHMFPKRPRITVGDLLVYHAVGSAKAFGEGRIFAVARVESEPEPSHHPQWPWRVRRRVILGVPHLGDAPTLTDIEVKPSSLRRQSHISLTEAQGQRAMHLIAAREPDGPDAPHRVVQDALEGMAWAQSIAFFGWSIALAMAAGPDRVVATVLRRERRFRIYGGIFTGASPWQGLLLASLDERELPPGTVADVERMGGRLTDPAGTSASLPHSVILGFPPERFDDLRQILEPAHRAHYLHSSAAGPSPHARSHRPDLLRYLREQARELGEGV